MPALALSLILSAVSPPAPAAAVRPPRPLVEVAFVLDTTGSMGGLIEGAKRRIWSIARRIEQGRPRPELRLALVGYRDRGDVYVTRMHDFAGDMDELHERLASFRAEGGGDAPEHVSRALADAVHGLSWSGRDSLKVIFLVGDAPPHLDYQDGFHYRRHVREARQRGIVVDAIQCGGDPQTAAVWREIASLGLGHYAQIDGEGGMPVWVTPVDADLARLNTELSQTVLASGSERERARTARKLASRAALPASEAAEAAPYFAASDRLAENDLVDLPAAEQKRRVEALRQDPAAAPPALKGLSTQEALAHLEELKDRRVRLQGRIQELQRQREEHLRRQGPASDAFDEQVVQALKARAASLGIRY